MDLDAAPPPAPEPAARGAEARDPALAAPAGAAWGEVPGLVARGVLIGSADVVPGVSGGTMALILGIYERLLAGVRSLDRAAVALLLRGRLAAAAARVHWRLLGAVAAGQALGVVLCTKGLRLPHLVETTPGPVYGVFFGLVLGSVLLLGRDVLRAGRPGPGVLAAASVGLALGVAVVRAVPAEGTPDGAWFLFVCGAVSICAMVLPGISGSFVLLLLRKYALVLGAVGEVIHPESGLLADRLRALTDVVLPFAAGCVVGLVAFARALGWLLARFERATHAAMVGLLAGSLWAIWPFQRHTWVEVRGKRRLIGFDPAWPTLDADGALVAALALAGFVAVLGLERLARGRPERAT